MRNISSSLKILLTIVIVLAGIEIGAKLMQTKISHDLQHILELDKLANHWPNSNLEDNTRILVIGNSLSRCAMPKNVFTKHLQKAGFKHPQIAYITPDGSDIATWLYSYQRFVSDPKLKPDLVIIGSGPKHLYDTPIQLPHRMGQYYVSHSSLRDYLRYELQHWSEAIPFLLGKYSTAFALRDRIQPYLFYNYAPGYTETTEAINQSRYHLKTSTESTPSFQRWQRFINSLEEQQIPTVLVSIPLPEAFNLPEQALQHLTSATSHFISLGNSEVSLNAQHFPDQYHLNESGAELFCQQFSQQLAKLSSLVDLQTIQAVKPSSAQ